MIWEDSGSADPEEIWCLMYNTDHKVLGELYTLHRVWNSNQTFYVYFYHPPLNQNELFILSELEQISEEQWTYYHDHPDEFYMEWLL